MSALSACLFYKFRFKLYAYEKSIHENNEPILINTF